MNIHECERKAIDDGAYDKAEFDLVGPNGKFHCRWLDAYMGILKADGQDGFWMTKQVSEIDGLTVENYHVPK